MDETIPGSYTLVTMPDGSQILMHMVGNEWVITKDRVKEAGFTDKFTDFKPTEHDPKTDGAIKEKPGPRNRLEAYLIEIVGQPENILAGEPMEMAKIQRIRAAKDGVFRHVLGMIDVMNCPVWNKVKDAMLKQGY